MPPSQNTTETDVCLWLKLYELKSGVRPLPSQCPVATERSREKPCHTFHMMCTKMFKRTVNICKDQVNSNTIIQYQWCSLRLSFVFLPCMWKTHQYIDCKQMTCKFFVSWDVASTLRICYAPPSNGYRLMPILPLSHRTTQVQGRHLHEVRRRNPAIRQHEQLLSPCLTTFSIILLLPPCHRNPLFTIFGLPLSIWSMFFVLGLGFEFKDVQGFWRSNLQLQILILKI